MPQARRKTPFSGKAKKQQLQNKKAPRLLLHQQQHEDPAGVSSESPFGTVSVNVQPTRSGREGNRYALKFYRETEQELRMKKEDAMRGLNYLPEEALEIEAVDYFPEELSFPKRPPWNFDMSRLQLEMQEQKYFAEYLNRLQKSHLWKDVSYMELNLETWRQLWRVLEMSDVLLHIVDIRFPAMMFPPSLYKHVVQDSGKDMILVLNKIDLVPAAVVAAWKHHFVTRYPGLRVVYFTSCPSYNLRGKSQDKAGLQIRRRKGRPRMSTEGAQKLLEACKDIVQERVDLTSWEDKIKEETHEAGDDDDAGPEVGVHLVEKPDTSFYEHERYRNGVLSIGCVGQPNVGKSSLMNSIMGRKVVSVSSTPGHTKHFQTIFLTPQVRLIDCPGLVFPSVVPRPVQILMGSYPIAQLREPYTTIRFIAERIDLPTLLRIQHPEGDDTWSPRDICDGWARKRGYLTAKAARLDTYRAANSLLRMALDGMICLSLTPKGFTKEKEQWETCEEIQYVKWVQALSDEDAATADSPVPSDPDDDDEEEESSEAESGEDTTTAMGNKFAALMGDE